LLRTFTAPITRRGTSADSLGDAQAAVFLSHQVHLANRLLAQRMKERTMISVKLLKIGFVLVILLLLLNLVLLGLNFIFLTDWDSGLTGIEHKVVGFSSKRWDNNRVEDIISWEETSGWKFYKGETAITFVKDSN
jgi:hypothetical protein